MFRSAPIRACIALAMAFAISCVAQAADAKPIRVGVLGLDNYQAVAFAQLFNDPKAAGDLAGLRVTAAFASPPSPEIPESVDGLPKWKVQIASFGVKLVDTEAELFAQSDVIMIMSLDGRRHLAQATRAIKAGKPTFIGRPLAASMADVVAILKLAKSSNVPLWTSSQHRFSPGFIGMRNHPEVGKVIGCDIYGGCPTEPNHSEYFWHTLHSIEALYAIMGPGCEKVQCTSTPLTESFTMKWADGRVATYRGIKKGAVKYSATVFGEKGVSVAGIYGHGVPINGVVPTNDEYMGYKGIAIEMAKFYKGGPDPVTPTETLELFAVLEAARASKQANGATVNVSDILDQANK